LQYNYNKSEIKSVGSFIVGVRTSALKLQNGKNLFHQFSGRGYNKKCELYPRTGVDEIFFIFF